MTRLMSLSSAAASVRVTAIRRPVDVIDGSKLLISDRVLFKIWLGNSRVLVRMCGRCTVMICTRCWICVCECIYVYMCVCMCVYMYVCMNVYMCICVYVCVYVCMSV
jgi:hypothetical protein